MQTQATSSLKSPAYIDITMLNRSHTKAMPPARTQTQQEGSMFPQGYRAGHNWTKKGALTGVIMYTCLCVYMPVCCGTQVQNINHYESALPIPLSKTLYFKVTNHSVIAADTKFLHDVTCVSEQNGVLPILTLPHGMNVSK